MSQIVDDMSTITAIVLGSGYPSAVGPWSRICAFVKEAQPQADNSAMPKLPCAKKWLEWCKVKAVPLDIQWDIYEWFTRQLRAGA